MKKNRKNTIFVIIFTILLYAIIKELKIKEIKEPNHPELIDGMIQITYQNNNWVKADKTNKDDKYQWYDYNNQIWANVALVKAETRTKYLDAKIGEYINPEDVLAYYVWIPRYKYKIFNIGKKEDYDFYNAQNKGIEIIFEKGTQKTGTVKCNYYYNNKIFSQNNEICIGKNGDYYTHPAFTFGTTELRGIWVGKFETTGDENLPTILPSQISLRNQNVATQFKTSKKFSTATYVNITTNNSIDAHMMKNVEWGAVAYLAYSKYGRCYDNCTEIKSNNNSNFQTGTIILNQENIYEYQTIIGMQTSTTNNIYGVYDMSGGSAEYVMANISKEKNIYKLNNYFYSGFDINWYNNKNYKYLDTYAYSEKLIGKKTNYKTKLGDAMGETSNWYDDNDWSAYNEVSWLERGGNYSQESASGIFAYAGNMGYNTRMNGFRSVLVKN